MTRLETDPLDGHFDPGEYAMAELERLRDTDPWEEAAREWATELHVQEAVLQSLSRPEIPWRPLWIGTHRGES